VNTPERFVAALADAHLPSVFNPYSETCPVHDRADAAELRRRNLARFLGAAIDARVDTMWIARDLGYRGGRRTGVPLTDEIHLDRAAALLGGIPLERATHGPVVAERTAAIVWRVLATIGMPAVLWNIFPFHPHERDDPFSNRCHTRRERERTAPLLRALVTLVRPRQIIAIGRDAHAALADMGLPALAVRHPSYGGQAEFAAGVYGFYGVTDPGADRAPLLPLRERQAASAVPAHA
jgi:uracil-DNA glycosylase